LGVDRLDVDTGAIRSYTTADGLAVGEVQDALRDAAGDLWFGTLTGISRLTPARDLPERVIPVRISSVEVAGQPQRVTGGAVPDIDHTKNNVEIDFAASGVFRSAPFRYEYRLDGAEKNWSAPTANRSIAYSSVRSGRYRFLVRTVTAGGLRGPAAAVSFQVLPPFWERWWFLAGAGAMLGAIVLAAHRHQVAHMLELERMRTRIACDLHDDVGSALSKIVILSEVAQRPGQNFAAATALDRIAETSREVLDSVGDLVWAIDPRTEHLEDLIRRMRAFSTQVFEAKNVEFQFEAIDVPLQKTISPEVLRQVYLIFKEAVNNAARHSQCTRSAVSLLGSPSLLTLTVSDNGKGFTPANGHDQHGIESLKARAAALQGEIRWTFLTGTEVTLRLPLPK
jgi:signal transduction histidine kinase